MNLFRAIGLKSDPFSTSPNVDLFYPATEHRQCLEGLELAIRMRRGLSVIKGGIGVGKTTISRKLIQNFKNESDDFTFHLILDPKFESEIILLKHIIDLFGINESAESVQDCRNIIENFLLKVGLEQGKTLVLIVDEGQNLPGEMLDVFRTLLNFETDEFKLLQLIIFGQPEMSKIIKNYPNFEDRIIFNFELGPITLEDTKGMIHHRINVTGGESKKWFTDESIIKIHKNTQGYPRKITQLCHQALLAMMSEDKESVSEEMVSKAISGKIDTSGLLKQKKKNYNKIAVNKLLDVLQEDVDNDNKKNNEDLDDDWIGDVAENKINLNKVEILSNDQEIEKNNVETKPKKN
ncbi:AAA family ATPase [Candidatus Marinimicrobia bacterium]|nr:AAA family ATPase [Candidatus Neomarinimicrobiota bacterium]